MLTSKNYVLNSTDSFDSIMVKFQNSYEHELVYGDLLNYRPLLNVHNVPKKSRSGIANKTRVQQRKEQVNEHANMNKLLDELSYRIALSLLNKIHAKTGDEDMSRIKFECFKYHQLITDLDTLNDTGRNTDGMKKSIIRNAGQYADGKDLLLFIKTSLLENGQKCFTTWQRVDYMRKEERKELTKIHTSFKTCKQTTITKEQTYLSWVYTETRRFIDGQKKRLENDRYTSSIDGLMTNENGETMDIRVPHSPLWINDKGQVNEHAYMELKERFNNLKLNDNMILFLYLYTDTNNYSLAKIGELYAKEKGLSKPATTGHMASLKKRIAKKFDTMGLDFKNVERLRKRNENAMKLQQELNR